MVPKMLTMTVKRRYFLPYLLLPLSRREGKNRSFRLIEQIKRTDANDANDGDLITSDRIHLGSHPSDLSLLSSQSTAGIASIDLSLLSSRSTVGIGIDRSVAFELAIDGWDRNRSIRRFRAHDRRLGSHPSICRF
jgi:hypothetical protein